MAEENKDDGALKKVQSELEKVRAELDAEKGKSAGILADKKKAQQTVDEFKQRLEELESKDLGEVEKLQKELERANSKLEKAEKEKLDIKAEFENTKRQNSLNQISKKFKFLDSVPEKARQTLIASEFSDVDLENEVIVGDRIKAITESYSGLLQAHVPDGTGFKPGAPASQSKLTKEAAINQPLNEIAKDPKAYVQSVLDASQAT